MNQHQLINAIINTFKLLMLSFKMTIIKNYLINYQLLKNKQKILK